MAGIDTIPYFWAFVAAAVASLLADGLVLWAAARRLRSSTKTIPSRAPELIAALAPLALIGILAAAVQEARDMIIRAPDLQAGPSEKAIMLARGMSGTINALAYGGLPIIIVVALAGVAVPMAVAARLRARGLTRAEALAATDPTAAAAWTRHPGPEPGILVAVTLAFLALGLGPIGRAALAATAARIKFFGAVAGADPGLKGRLMLQHLDESAQQMREGLFQARVGVVLATIVAVVLVVVRSPARARARAIGRPAESPAAGVVVLALVFLTLAGIAFAAARPFQRENDTPWPATNPNAMSISLDAKTPDLTGPDPVERAPAILVTTKGLSLDGRSVDTNDLEESLDTLHRNYRLLHPGGLFSRKVLVACTPDTPRPRLLRALSAALRAGFERPSLVFLREQVNDRPLLGPRRRTLATGADFALVTASDQAEEGSVVLEGFTDCADLGRRLVDLRGAGKSVALKVPR